MNFAAFLIE
jgi:voltage-gated potassium channel Kch